MPGLKKFRFGMFVKYNSDYVLLYICQLVMLLQMDIKNRFCLLASLIVLIAVGCNNGAATLMDSAETIMQEHPKNALALLDSLKQHPLKGKAINARFALLYSMALDKSYIDVTDDSLISVAEDWYLKHGTAKEKFLVHYYKGVVNKNAKNFPESITAFSQAEKLRNKISDNYLLGLLYNQMGIIYNRHYEYNKSLNAFTQAHHLYELAEKSNHMNYMLMYIASCYWNMGDYANSEEYYKQAIRVGEQTNYKALVNLSVINLIGQYVEQERFSDALALNEKYKIGITPKRVKYAGNIARLMYMTGNGQKGADLMTQAWEFAASVEDSVALYINEYYIYKDVNNTKMSLEALTKADVLKTKSVALKLQHPVLEIQKQLLEKDLEHSLYQIKMERTVAILAAILMVILISAGIYFLRRWMKIREDKLKNYICLIEDLRDTLQHLQDVSFMKDVQLSTATADAADVIKNRLALVNNLSILFYERQGTPKAKEVFIKEVEKIIEDFKTSKEDLKWMERIINCTKENLLDKTYANYPTLNDDEKKLLCYIYAGFSPKAISVFLNIPIETVYNRKSRLLAKTGLSKTKNTTI